MANESPWGGDALTVKDPEERLSKEIHNFIEYIAPTSKETRLRKDAIEAISDTVKSLWPSTEVQVYGSFKTNLVLPSSDVDLCVKTVEALQPRKAKNYLFQLRNALTRRNLTTDTMVPILVTKMLKSQIAADVCLNTESESTLKTTEWLIAYPDLKALYLVLKHGLSSLKVDNYLRFHMMDSKSQGIAGFTLICLIVRYLQANFDFSEKGIYLRDGGGYFEKKDKPDDSPLHAPYVVVIEDPNLKNVNTGRATSQLDGVKAGFKKAHRLLKDRIDSAQDGSILSAFILLPKAINGIRPVGTDYNLENLEDMKNPVDLGSTRDAVRNALSKSSNHKRSRGAVDDYRSGPKRQRTNTAYQGNRKNFRK
ncbi:hypothetical protein INT43_002273 [Umbelopsis isabellina]|uniref:Poly(A) RNA polymerase mitochondrial-like central palm domain-containing protein n=1 Tax=Mortierella isabellina TaxID=91625 RepID=A0A8H7Q6W3_MORIS|nr:hypothetical protein INT43_002273 [Umbelopsis isabellina]